MFSHDPFRRRADGNDETELDAGRRELRGRAGGDKSAKVIARHRRLNLRCAGGDDDFDSWVETQHSGCGPRHDQRPGINANGVLPRVAVQRFNVGAGCARFICSGAPGRSLPDDNDVAVNRPCGHRMTMPATLERRQFTGGRVGLNVQAAVERDLARTDVGDTVHRGEAMRTVAGETQTPSPCGMTAILQEASEDGISRHLPRGF